MPFQTAVRTGPAPAVEGDFASANPRANYLAGAGGLVAGPNGLRIARFAWVDSLRLDSNDAPAVANNYGTGAPNGFIHREMQALITGYLEESGMRIIPGVQCTVHDAGDFWVKNAGTTYGQVGQKVFANSADGSAACAAAGATVGGASGSASSIAAATSSSTGSITNNVLTLSAVGSGTIVAGTTISGTGVASGTKITGQVLPLIATEVLGGKGRYTVSIPGQTVASTAISGTYGVLTVGGTVAGTFGPGQAISGTNVVAGTTITQQLTGTTGGSGTYVVDNNTVVASTAISSSAFVETKWWVASPSAVGEIFKMTSRTLR